MVKRYHNIIVEEPVVEYDYPWWYGGYGGYDYASSWNEPSHHHSGWGHSGGHGGGAGHSGSGGGGHGSGGYH